MRKNEENLSIEEMLKEYKTYIPYGLYCYDEYDNSCPFFELKEGEYPEQEDGYCHYLKKSDWELNEEYEKTTILIQSKNKENEGKSIKVLMGVNYAIDPISKKKCHFPISSLWDECKECSINISE